VQRREPTYRYTFFPSFVYQPIYLPQLKPTHPRHPISIRPQDAMTMFRLLKPRPCPQWTAAVSRRCRCPAPDSTFMLFRASPWSPQCPENSPLWTSSARKGLGRPLVMYVCPSPRCLDRSDVHFRKSRGSFVLGKGIPYSNSKEPTERERYAREFPLLQVSAASSVVPSALLPPDT
jgi:hypothetical protein